MTVNEDNPILIWTKKIVYAVGWWQAFLVGGYKSKKWIMKDE